MTPIVGFQINDIRNTEQYRRAVDAAAIAKAKVEQSEQERRQAEVVAQRQKIQAEGEANAVRKQARGKADGELLLATAQAKGKELVGLAEAKALEAQGQALRSNTSRIQLEVAKRWSGNLPVNMYGSAPLPLLNLPADGPQASPRKGKRQLRGRLAWRRVAPTSSWITPGSVMAWPASATMRKSASGQTRDKSHAFLTGVTTS